MLPGYPVHVSASTSSECMVPACARTPVPAADLCPQHVDELTRTLAQVAGLVVPLRKSTLRVTTHRSYTARPSGGGEPRDVSAAWNPAATPVADTKTADGVRTTVLDLPPDAQGRIRRTSLAAFEKGRVTVRIRASYPAAEADVRAPKVAALTETVRASGP